MNRINDCKGSVLLISLLFGLILAIGVAALIHLTGTQSVIVRAEATSARAFYLADAGVALAVQDMYDDFEYTPTGQVASWADANLWGPAGVSDLSQGGSIAIPQDYPNFYQLIPETWYIGGTYTVDIANEPGRDNMIWIRSKGVYMGQTRTILVRLRIRDISPWNNAIFAGEGAGGKVINGNVDIRGSVHILGTSLTPADLAVDMSGGGNIGNNYEGMPASLFNRVPSILKVYGAAIAEDLETEVRVQHGKVALSGTANIGKADSPGYKGSVAGTYVTDGYGGNQGTTNVVSDNGTAESYDITDPITFPKLTEPYQAYPTYMDYLRDNALIINDPADLATLANITPGTVFNASSAKGSLELDGAGNIQASGIVFIEGPVEFSGQPADVMLYTGKASIVSTADIEIKVDILTKWFGTYPQTDLIGFMSSGDITLNKVQLNVMGVFYAENQIISTKQTNVAGTFFSRYFDMGSQVPAIFQIPNIVNSLPPGMIGNQRYWTLRKEIWREISSP